MTASYYVLDVIARFMCFSAMDEFNHAVVLTHRPLTPGEHFEIQIDKVIEKWAGSVEIGVTTHDPLTLDFPSVMTNIQVSKCSLLVGASKVQSIVQYQPISLQLF